VLQSNNSSTPKKSGAYEECCIAAFLNSWNQLLLGTMASSILAPSCKRRFILLVVPQTHAGSAQWTLNQVQSWFTQHPDSSSYNEMQIKERSCNYALWIIARPLDKVCHLNYITDERWPGCWPMLNSIALYLKLHRSCVIRERGPRKQLEWKNSRRRPWLLQLKTPDLQFILIGRNPGDIDHHLNIITLYLTLHNRRWP
jgi:hypothetical protein